MSTYTVTVYEQGAWIPALGRAPIVRTCPHAHRTLSGAARCWEKLQDQQRDGARSANWYHAQVAHTDGSHLETEESNALWSIRLR